MQGITGLSACSMTTSRAVYCFPWLQRASSAPTSGPAAIRRTATGPVLRCYNATGRETAGAWRFSEGVKTAHRVRADERDSQALLLEHRGRTLRFVAKPYEIITIQIT